MRDDVEHGNRLAAAIIPENSIGAGPVGLHIRFENWLAAGPLEGLVFLTI